MKLKQLLKTNMGDHEIMEKINTAMIQGASEIRLGDAIIKLTHVQFEKHIAPWEK